ncbi:hypothetical protein [Prescottella subtropica]|uniref:hypothetical protein n=1 Tax=Prescottella subtropica TaxID=2545757 RepID=UPI001386B85B|nr:hypothetical protein [Prescottella subtropica]
MIERATKLTAKTPPAALATLVIAATVGLMMLLGAAPADAESTATGAVSISVDTAR